MRTSNRFLYTAILFTVLSALACGCSRKNLPDKKTNEALGAVYQIGVTQDDHPWKQVMGIYGLGNRFVVIDSATQDRIQAISLLQQGISQELLLTDKSGAYFSGKAGGKEGERFRNQFVGVLTDAKVTSKEVFISNHGEEIELDSLARRAFLSLDPAEFATSIPYIPGSKGNDLGWSLLTLARINLLTFTWENIKGKRVNGTDILAAALDRKISWGPYSGLMEQLGIAAAVRTYKMNILIEKTAEYEALKKRGVAGDPPILSSIKVDGIWSEASKHKEEVISTLQKNQWADGTFGSSWHKEKSKPKNAKDAILYTGCTLDFLAEALDDSQLNDPWVTSTVNALANLLVDNKGILSEEVDASMHSAHALMRYKERLKNIGKPVQTEVYFNDETDLDNPGCCK